MSRLQNFQRTARPPSPVRRFLMNWEGPRPRGPYGGGVMQEAHMNKDYVRADKWSEQVIGAAICLEFLFEQKRAKEEGCIAAGGGSRNLLFANFASFCSKVFLFHSVSDGICPSR